MSHGLLVILRYFLLALLWLFFLYAARMVVVEVRRGRRDAAARDGVAMNGVARTSLKLRVVQPRERRGEVVDLNREVTLGRSPSCVLAVEDDTFASSVHARVFVRDGEAYVEDLGSTNGTFVNEERIAEPTLLGRGDLLRVGATVLEVRR